MIKEYELHSCSPKIMLGRIVKDYVIIGIMSPALFRKLYMKEVYSIINNGRKVHGDKYGREPMIYVGLKEPRKNLTIEELRLSCSELTEDELQAMYETIPTFDMMFLPHHVVLQHIEEEENGQGC